MERLVSELESLIADIAFGGTDEAGAEIKKRLASAAALCRELGMSTGENICAGLSSAIFEDESSDPVKALCVLGFYCECIKMME